MEKRFLEQIPEVARDKGVATILAIGTANPPNSILQADYPDFYFRVTNSDHQDRLKLKFKRICEHTKIEKRHIVLTEDFLKQNSNTGTYEGLPLEKRLQQPTEEVIKLAQEAALKAIKEWGQPLSQITHLIFYTTSCYGSVPGPDFHLTKLLSLKPTVNRLMMFVHGCHAGGTVLRVAKDIAENNVGSRVLAVCAETTFASFHAPSASNVDALIGHALFGDGAAALIIGADPNPSIEHPLFEIVLASQTTIPDTENAIKGHPHDMGLVYYLDKDIPNIVSDNVKKCLVDELSSIGFNEDVDWNNLFYAIHPGGPHVLNKVEEELGLDKEKLRGSWNVLRQYGNMWSTTVIFVLDEVRKRSKTEGKSTTGEGLEWGVLLGFGPGLAMETVVLHGITVNHE
ncbi:Thiolase-like [Sesbania bispinosa]|nr:Thiolase-like [Sesbania bispinosa]